MAQNSILSDQVVVPWARGASPFYPVALWCCGLCLILILPGFHGNLRACSGNDGSWGEGGGTGGLYVPSGRACKKLSGWLLSSRCILQLMICSEGHYVHKAHSIIYMFVPCLVLRRFTEAAHPGKLIQYLCL